MSIERGTLGYLKQGLTKGPDGKVERIVWLPDIPDALGGSIVKRVPLNVLEAAGLKLADYSNDSTEIISIIFHPNSTDIAEAESRGPIRGLDELFKRDAHSRCRTPDFCSHGRTRRVS